MNKTCKDCGHYYNEKWGLGMCFRHDDMTVSPDRAACSWFQTEFRADKMRMSDEEVNKLEEELILTDTGMSGN